MVVILKTKIVGCVLMALCLGVMSASEAMDPLPARADALPVDLTNKAAVFHEVQHLNGEGAEALKRKFDKGKIYDISCYQLDVDKIMDDFPPSLLNAYARHTFQDMLLLPLKKKLEELNTMTVEIPSLQESEHAGRIARLELLQTNPRIADYFEGYLTKTSKITLYSALDNHIVERSRPAPTAFNAFGAPILQLPDLKYNHPIWVRNDSFIQAYGDSFKGVWATLESMTQLYVRLDLSIEEISRQSAALMDKHPLPLS